MITLLCILILGFSVLDFRVTKGIRANFFIILFESSEILTIDINID